jgi:hypothetical protein
VETGVELCRLLVTSLTAAQAHPARLADDIRGHWASSVARRPRHHLRREAAPQRLYRVQLRRVTGPPACQRACQRLTFWQATLSWWAIAAWEWPMANDMDARICATTGPRWARR